MNKEERKLLRAELSKLYDKFEKALLEYMQDPSENNKENLIQADKEYHLKNQKLWDWLDS